MLVPLGRACVRRRWHLAGRRARGLAEIVGTLMLIVIVVAAAVALAAFVASYQKQLQAEESQSQQRGLESIKILSVTPTQNLSDPTTFGNLSFVLASEYINPSVVESISLNGQPLKVYWALDISNLSGAPSVHGGSIPLNLSPREEVVITVNLTAGPMRDYTWFSAYDDNFVLTTSDYIELSVYTALQNTFTQVFIPPAAVAYVTALTSYTASGPIEIPVLDGTSSFQPSGNATIVQWEWTVSNVTKGVIYPNLVGTFSGAEWEFTGIYDPPNVYAYNATLTVTNSYGLEAKTNLTFSSYIIGAV